MILLLLRDCVELYNILEFVEIFVKLIEKGIPAEKATEITQKEVDRANKLAKENVDTSFPPYFM